MPTKVIVLGEPTSTEQKQPIKFLFCVTNGHQRPGIDSGPGFRGPSVFKYIELIARSYCHVDLGGRLDLMFAYNDPNSRGEGVLFLGHFNDGVVE